MSVAKDKLFIDGAWIDSQEKKTIEIKSPIDGAKLGSAQIATSEDVNKAVEAASSAADKWGRTHFVERAEIMHKAADIFEKRFEELVNLLIMEQGKPKADAQIESQGCVNYFRDAAEDIKRLQTDMLPSIDPKKRVYTIRQPYGVFGVITPWNFPFDIPCFIIAPVLASGNTLVFKPAEQTPLCGAKIVECLEKAGFPKGVVNLVQGPGEITGEAMSANGEINAIAFTGSIETGRRIAERAGKTIKHLLLELGGNGPVIVLDDADLELATEAIALSCYMNAGQVCNAGERILVTKQMNDRLTKSLLQKTAQIKLGDPRLPETTMGPLIDETVASKIDSHIKDAVEKGAKLTVGGKRATGFPTKLYFEPTILNDVSPDMLISREETFGPVCPLIECENIEEAAQIANQTDYGLMSSVFTKDLAKGIKLAELIKTGTVAINTPSNYWEGRLPWGGMRKSGLGRQGGIQSIISMTQLKTIILDLG